MDKKIYRLTIEDDKNDIGYVAEFDVSDGIYTPGRIDAFKISNVLGDFLYCVKAYVYSSENKSELAFEQIPDFHPFYNWQLQDGKIDTVELYSTMLYLEKILDFYKKNNNKDSYKYFDDVKNLMNARFTFNRFKSGETKSDGTDILFYMGLDEVFSCGNLFEEGMGYRYECENLNEMLLAILHFYIINGYKITNCEHCNKIFATKTLKNKYCERIDQFPFKKKQNKTCEESVRYMFNKYLRDKRLSLKKSMESSIKEKSDSKLNEFLNECDKYMDIIKSEHSIKNILSYNSYLDSMLIRKRKEEII